MSYTKLNVFHWHITDGESFPFESQTFPDLVKGAYSDTKIYTHRQISALIQYAYLRGIVIIPEIDSPGHVRSWGAGYPEVVLP